eukprot:25906-Eustigmatos_ZCMA.PRE.1
MTGWADKLETLKRDIFTADMKVVAVWNDPDEGTRKRTVEKERKLNEGLESYKITCTEHIDIKDV